MKVAKAANGRDIEKIMQLNLAEISHCFAAMHYNLPTQGRLYFYVSIEDCDSDSMKVRGECLGVYYSHLSVSLPVSNTRSS